MADAFLAEVQAYAAKAAADIARDRAEAKARNNALFPDFIAAFRRMQDKFGAGIRFVGCVGTGPDNAGCEMWGKDVDESTKASVRNAARNRSKP